MDKRVRNVVDRYLSVLIVEDVNDDAGWRAEHLMGRIIEFEGDLPPHM